eukprot:TRINITY_DN4666_c0_g1_i1.p1 TRINITY_DN4666_c0_g1~~TRINITY_DN4666_c0_g1_i1.p1  ORF type:complete len:727 (-),score=154.97 TRINITY_DN4666_c0_g1_i1:2291-4471(-)
MAPNLDKSLMEDEPGGDAVVEEKKPRKGGSWCSGSCLFVVEEGDEAEGGDNPEGGGDAQAGEEAFALIYGWRGQNSYLEISVSCEDIVNPFRGLRRNDTMAVVSLCSVSGDWEEIGRTEVIKDTQSPQFVQQTRFLYMFEENQKLLFRIYDMEGDASPSSADVVLEGKQVLGEAMTLVPEILLSAGKSKTWHLAAEGTEFDEDSNVGGITVRAEEVSLGQNLAAITVHARNLLKMDWFSASDPFVIVSRHNEDDTWTPVYKTEVVVDSKSPDWAVIKITLQHLCQGIRSRLIKFEVLDFDVNGKHPSMGYVTMTVHELEEAAGKGIPFELMKPVRKRKPDGPLKACGQFFVDEYSIVPRPTFLDFVFGGCKMSFMVAVDFTASNGDPNLPGTLHYVDPELGHSNAYEKAIKAVGDSLQFYDYDRRYPAWGFGGKLPNEPVSHCFALNGNDDKPEVKGVAGILEAYHSSIQRVGLAGPTLFTPVMKAACERAAALWSQENQKYFVLLIITDGCIADLDDTVEQLVEACKLPMSTIIMGVGQANFDWMEVLDAQNNKLAKENGEKAIRDAVSFLPLRDIGASDKVAKKFLRELPGQVLEFMSIKGVTPNKRSEDDDANMKRFVDRSASVLSQTSLPSPASSQKSMSSVRNGNEATKAPVPEPPMSALYGTSQQLPAQQRAPISEKDLIDLRDSTTSRGPPGGAVANGGPPAGASTARRNEEDMIVLYD